MKNTHSGTREKYMPQSFLPMPIYIFGVLSETTYSIEYPARVYTAMA